MRVADGDRAGGPDTEVIARDLVASDLDGRPALLGGSPAGRGLRARLVYRSVDQALVIRVLPGAETRTKDLSPRCLAHRGNFQAWPKREHVPSQRLVATRRRRELA
jgi:hypothetical protein